MSDHPLAEVRQRQNPDWLSVCQEAILDVLRRRPNVHADDLTPLGIPEDRKNCIGSAFASLASKRWIEQIDRRASQSRSRNSAKSGVYQLTHLGRIKLTAGVAAGTEAGHRRAKPGEIAAPRASDDPDGEGSSGGSAEEPATRLFDEPEPAHPRSAFTDDEA